MSDWIFHNKPVQKAPAGCVGFVYTITNTLTGQKYIGKKFVNSVRRKKVKGRKNRKVVVSESKWKNYYGSCDELLMDIELTGKDFFKREIVAFYSSKALVNYEEVALQMKCDVLRALSPTGDKAYYNMNIMGKFFPRNLKVKHDGTRKTNRTVEK